MAAFASLNGWPGCASRSRRIASRLAGETPSTSRGSTSHCGPSAMSIYTARLVLLPLVAMHDAALYLYIAKPVGAIQGRDRLHILPQEIVAEPAVPELQHGGRPQIHPLADGFDAERPVAPDRHQRQLVPLAAVDAVFDHLLAWRGLRGEVHLGVEVALALHVLAQVVGALDQQIAIDRALFENRHQLLQLAPRDLRAQDRELDLRAALDVQTSDGRGWSAGPNPSCRWRPAPPGGRASGRNCAPARPRPRCAIR